MTRPTKPLAATDRLGVYKHLADVPDRYRLERHAEAYTGADTWSAFCDAHEYSKGESEDFRRKVDRAGVHWRDFVEERQPHHAIATPADVEAWSAELLDEFTLSTAYKYWIRVEHFFRWLMWHTEHPHVYHPVLMAVCEFDAAATEVWAWKTDNVRRRRGRA